MKKFNKVIAGLLCGLLVLSPVQAFAAESDADVDAVITTIESDFEKVVVSASLAADTGVTSGRISLDVDAEELELVDVDTEEFTLTDFNEDELSFAWVSEEAVSEETKLFTLTFEAKNATSGKEVSVVANVDELFAEDEAVATEASETLTTTLSLLDIAPISSVTYTGKALTPAVTVMHNGEKVDSKLYKVSYKDNKNVGTATVTVTGKGAYKGKSNTTTFEITPKVASNKNSWLKTSTFPIDVHECTVWGKLYVDGTALDAKDVKFVLTDSKGNVVKKNTVTSGGTYTMTATASGNYTGTVTKTVKVTKKEIRVFGHLVTCIWLLS